MRIKLFNQDSSLLNQVEVSAHTCLISLGARNPIASKLKRMAIAPKSNSKAIALNSTQVGPTNPTLQKLY
ncbi:hypothetical protein CP500_011160 [Tychonema bourrellyi FEM_GT703]|uniref:Uncharacterized protein n=1 Tax=Tychonema bourrellyi FEM_GT703 TaxID=2040638 RepID=A0A2G4F0R4_9CYAN|nr:hypothetical protein [Tychonema bourrellyi]PHX55350.1 hypothetical protein CP500_011160 [Tychonema bourrellyi FEM_GT703]